MCVRVQELYEGSACCFLFPTIAIRPRRVAGIEHGQNKLCFQPRAFLEHVETAKTKIKRHILAKITLKIGHRGREIRSGFLIVKSDFDLAVRD